MRLLVARKRRNVQCIFDLQGQQQKKGATGITTVARRFSICSSQVAVGF
jgi:hypothetical protein